MAESSWPTVAGGRSITDIQWEEMAAGFAASGVIGAPTDTPVIYADSTGMQIKVRANKLALVSGNGWTSGPTEFTKAIGSNGTGSTRIDLVVLRLTRSTRTVTVEVRAGSPGSGVPAAVQDSMLTGTGIWELPLAQVTVAAGASTIAAGNVVSVAKYIGSGNANAARPKLFAQTSGVSGAWSNTSGPTSDAVDALGMYQAARMTIDKQSPDTALEIRLDLSGYASASGRIFCGVRVMATGYTSSNHLVGAFYFNRPLYMVTDASPWFSTALVSMSNHADHAHSVSPSQHNHGLTIPHQHQTWGGMAHLTGLAARTYTVQPYIYTAGTTFYMDTNDQLMFRLAEV